MTQRKLRHTVNAFILCPEHTVTQPSQPDLILIEASLRERRKDILGALYRRLHHADAPDELAMVNYFDTIDDRAGAASMNDTELAQLSHEMDELRQLDLALARVIGGDYGQCAACGEAIAAARLQAEPAATMCIACQTRAEQGGGHGPRQA